MPMRNRLDTPLKFRCPLKVIGPLGNNILPGDESYALMSTKAGAIGYWPKTDVHDDGYWRLTRNEAEFIAQACLEKAAREDQALKAELLAIRDKDHNAPGNNEETVSCPEDWPAVLRGVPAVGVNLRTGKDLTGEDIYTLMLEVVQKSYQAFFSPTGEVSTGDARKLVDEVLEGSKKA